MALFCRTLSHRRWIPLNNKAQLMNVDWRSCRLVNEVRHSVSKVNASNTSNALRPTTDCGTVEWTAVKTSTSHSDTGAIKSDLRRGESQHCSGGFTTWCHARKTVHMWDTASHLIWGGYARISGRSTIKRGSLTSWNLWCWKIRPVSLCVCNNSLHKFHLPS